MSCKNRLAARSAIPMRREPLKTTYAPVVPRAKDATFIAHARVTAPTLSVSALT